MIEHDNNTVYFFPNKQAVKIFSIRNREMFMYPGGLCRAYRDCNGGVYFSFLSNTSYGKVVLDCLE